MLARLLQLSMNSLLQTDPCFLMLPHHCLTTLFRSTACKVILSVQVPTQYTHFGLKLSENAFQAYKYNIDMDLIKHHIYHTLRSPLQTLCRPSPRKPCKTPSDSMLDPLPKDCTLNCEGHPSYDLGCTP